MLRDIETAAIIQEEQERADAIARMRSDFEGEHLGVVQASAWANT